MDAIALEVNSEILIYLKNDFVLSNTSQIYKTIPNAFDRKFLTLDPRKFLVIIFVIKCVYLD